MSKLQHLGIVQLARLQAPRVGLLTLMQSVSLLTLPICLLFVSSRAAVLVLVVLGAAFAFGRLIIMQNMRRALRVSCMVESSSDALASKRMGSESENDSAFWFAHMLEYAVSVDLPSILASGISLATILLISFFRIEGPSVAVLSGVLSLGALLGFVLHRRLQPRAYAVIEARRKTSAWIAAASRDRGEIASNRARSAFFASLSSATESWCDQEDTYERRRSLLRGLLGVFVLFALLAAVVFYLQFSPFSDGSMATRLVVDWAFFASAFPMALILARSGDSLLTSNAQIRGMRRLEAPKPQPPALVRLDHRPHLLSVRNLVVRYGEHRAVSVPYLEIDIARSVGISGPNGSGKTSFASILAGVELEHDGEVLLDGVSIRSIDKDCIGFVPQDPVLIEDLSLAENVRLVAPWLDDTSIRQALLDVGLERDISLLAGQLSRGERKRIAFARALAKAPVLLILDEPDAWMDASGRQMIGDLIHQQRSQRSVVVVSHRSELVASLDVSVCFSAERELVEPPPPTCT